MASFAPWASALAGFRLVRERPLAVLAWAAVNFAGRLFSLTLTTIISGRYMPALNAAMNAKTINLQDLATAYRPAAPGFLAGAVAALPFTAIVIAAIYRAYLRPEDGRWRFLRLGQSEAAIFALIVALNLLVMFGLFFAALVIGVAANLAADADQAAGGMVEVLGAAGAVFAVIWAMARLSLAWPMAFLCQRQALLRSWRLTKAQAMPLLGAFVLAEGLMLLVAVLLFAIFGGVGGAVAVAMGGTVDQMFESMKSATAVTQVFQPLPLAFLAYWSLLLTLLAVTLQGVAVSAYRSFVPPEPPV